MNDEVTPLGSRVPGEADEPLARVAAGDQDAFAVVYDLLAPAVFGTALRVLRDRSRAEEVAQDVLAEVWRTAARFDATRGSARAWVLTIAHRRAVDRVRSDHASAVRDDRVGRESLERDHDVVTDEVEYNLEVEALRGCLETLSEIQRESVLLAYYGGHTYAEVSGILGAPLGTVKTRLRDGLKRLRNCLGVSS